VVVEVTGLVDTNVGTTLLLTPAGTVIVAGTVTAAVLLLENTTTAPSLGAGAVSVTVTDAVAPPCTLAGLRLTVSSVAVGGGAGAVTVMVAVRVIPLYVAEITDDVVELTALVATEEVVAEVLPAGTVIVAGTVTAAVLLLVSDNTAPPAGAGAVSATVAEAVAPPCTVAGLRLTELRATAVTVHPDSRTLTAAAEPSFTSTVQSAGAV
jgi:hypothetical protein